MGSFIRGLFAGYFLAVFVVGYIVPIIEEYIGGRKK